MRLILDIYSKISDDFNELVLILRTGVNAKCGGCEFKVDDPLSITLRSYLKEGLTDFASYNDC